MASKKRPQITIISEAEKARHTVCHTDISEYAPNVSVDALGHLIKARNALICIKARLMRMFTFPYTEPLPDVHGVGANGEHGGRLGHLIRLAQVYVAGFASLKSALAQVGEGKPKAAADKIVETYKSLINNMIGCRNGRSEIANLFMPGPNSPVDYTNGYYHQLETVERAKLFSIDYFVLKNGIDVPSPIKLSGKLPLYELTAFETEYLKTSESGENTKSESGCEPGRFNCLRTGSGNRVMKTYNCNSFDSLREIIKFGNKGCSSDSNKENIKHNVTVLNRILNSLSIYNNEIVKNIDTLFDEIDSKSIYDAYSDIGKILINLDILHTFVLKECNANEEKANANKKAANDTAAELNELLLSIDRILSVSLTIKVHKKDSALNFNINGANKCIYLTKSKHTSKVPYFTLNSKDAYLVLEHTKTAAAGGAGTSSEVNNYILDSETNMIYSFTLCNSMKRNTAAGEGASAAAAAAGEGASAAAAAGEGASAGASAAVGGAGASAGALTGPAGAESPITQCQKHLIELEKRPKNIENLAYDDKGIKISFVFNGCKYSGEKLLGINRKYSEIIINKSYGISDTIRKQLPIINYSVALSDVDNNFSFFYKLNQFELVPPKKKGGARTTRRIQKYYRNRTYKRIKARKTFKHHAHRRRATRKN
jgi:hypothetical protein